MSYSNTIYCAKCHESEKECICAQEDFPAYTKAIKDLSSVYIKDGHVIKNRGDRNIIRKDEVNNFNNIVIETDKVVNIYCDEEMSKKYINIVDILKERHSGVDDKIIINIDFSRFIKKNRITTVFIDEDYDYKL